MRNKVVITRQGRNWDLRFTVIRKKLQLWKIVTLSDMVSIVRYKAVLRNKFAALKKLSCNTKK